MSGIAGHHQSWWCSGSCSVAGLCCGQ